ncbi:MAG: iron-containing alcohol dehydrogenase [Promethearchaeota archaeon]|nr:MAG: iron-containing alcohol dehydrogenase [Candidatus Lokiarchaeota archaeon]
MRNNLYYGSKNAIATLNSLDSFILVTQNPPFDNIFQKKLTQHPIQIIYPTNVDIHYLKEMSQKVSRNKDVDYVVGFGGGVAIDTAKFFSWKWKKPLIQIPSIISTDAFLTHEIGIRVDNKVQYIGKAVPEQIIIDFDVIKSAPKVLNYAGTCDVLSICTALGDWKIAYEEFGDKIDKKIYSKARNCAQNLLNDAPVIREMQEEGIRKLVGYLQEEMQICTEWGNARPEEGGEHHLAYCIEELSPKRYLHGALVALNILTVLRLQGDYAEFSYTELKDFFDFIGHSYKFEQIGITEELYRRALHEIHFYVQKETLEKGIWFKKDLFSNISISDVINWILGF